MSSSSLHSADDIYDIDNYSNIGWSAWWGGGAGPNGGEGFWIEVRLPENRDNYGSLTVLNGLGIVIYGPVPVLGRSADYLASRNGHSNRNSLRQYGDTPLGVYKGVAKPSSTRRYNGRKYSDEKTRSGLLSYGNEGLIALDPIAGDALSAKENGGRAGLLIHSGDLRNKRLRPTAGCIRMFPNHMKNVSSIVYSLEEVPFLFVEGGVVALKSDTPFLPDVQDDYDDPPIGMDETITQDMWIELAYGGDIVRDGEEVHINWIQYFNSGKYLPDYHANPSWVSKKGLGPRYRSYRSDMDWYKEYLLEKNESGDFYVPVGKSIIDAINDEYDMWESMSNPAYYIPYADIEYLNRQARMGSVSVGGSGAGTRKRGRGGDDSSSTGNGYGSGSGSGGGNSDDCEADWCIDFSESEGMHFP